MRPFVLFALTAGIAGVLFWAVVVGAPGAAKALSEAQPQSRISEPAIERMAADFAAHIPADSPECAAADTTAAADELNLYAQSAVLMDGETGRILYGKNEAVVRPMASTTKIMTCIVALENGNLDDTVTASKLAASQPKVHLGVYEGQQFKLENLLYSLMLESHNDSAVMIAEHIGGSVEDFARMMNQKAKEIGCSDTYFITPNGLDASETVDGEKKEHSTTAADLARIMNYCIGKSPKKDQFLEITETQNYFFCDQEEKRSYGCTNHNALLTMMDGVLSGKTGFTGGAGYSYVGSVEHDGRRFTIALLGCGWPPHKTYKWSDARKLISYGKDRYAFRNVYEEQKFAPVPVKNGIPSTGDLNDPVNVSCEIRAAGEDRELKLLMADDEKVEISQSMPESLKAPVREGQSIGTVTYRLDGQIVKVYPVCAAESVDKLKLSWCFEKIREELLQMPGLSCLTSP